MQHRNRRLLLLLVASLPLILTGCNEVVLENPLPTIVDDRIVGSWAAADGKLAYVIKRGEGQSYESLTASDLTSTTAKPTVFYLARAGGELFGETRGNCSAYQFSAPDPKDAPDGCWTVFHIVLSNDRLEYDNFDPMKFVKRSVAGEYFPVGLRYGVEAAKGSMDRSADVLIQGPATETGPFLANYSKDPVYSSSSSMHRIG